MEEGDSGEVLDVQNKAAVENFLSDVCNFSTSSSSGTTVGNSTKNLLAKKTQNMDETIDESINGDVSGVLALRGNIHVEVDDQTEEGTISIALNLSLINFSQEAGVLLDVPIAIQKGDTLVIREKR